MKSVKSGNKSQRIIIIVAYIKLTVADAGPRFCSFRSPAILVSPEWVKRDTCLEWAGPNRAIVSLREVVPEPIDVLNIVN